MATDLQNGTTTGQGGEADGTPAAATVPAKPVTMESVTNEADATAHLLGLVEALLADLEAKKSVDAARIVEVRDAVSVVNQYRAGAGAGTVQLSAKQLGVIFAALQLATPIVQRGGEVDPIQGGGTIPGGRAAAGGTN